MIYKRNRLFYIIMIFVVICLGLLSRRLNSYMPDMIDLYLGDSLWALMIYLFIGTFFYNWSIKKVALTATIFCFLIELSQLYHADWIDMLRSTTLGGLVLGYGFLWSDLAAYLMGTGIGMLIEYKLSRR